jgi:Jun-like transcription factor
LVERALNLENPSLDANLNMPAILFLIIFSIDLQHHSVIFNFHLFSPYFQVTTEQEDYARGFEDALNNLHKNENPKTTSAQQQQPSPPQQQQQSSQSQSSTKQISVASSTTAITMPTNVTTVTTVVTNTMSGGGITYTNLGECQTMLFFSKKNPIWILLSAKWIYFVQNENGGDLSTGQNHPPFYLLDFIVAPS